ncbi:aromatic-ring hydroxylase C-terminal domain-containing protein [Streptomyces sp. NY05-11A]
MISAQDTVLPVLAGDGGPEAGTFLANIALTTAAGDTDVIELLQEGRPLLLLFGDGGARHLDRARPWGRTLKVSRAESVPEVPYEAAVVRPDGYLAWTSDGGDLRAALLAYFAEDAAAGRP